MARGKMEKRQGGKVASRLAFLLFYRFSVLPLCLIEFFIVICIKVDLRFSRVGFEPTLVNNIKKVWITFFGVQKALFTSFSSLLRKLPSAAVAKLPHSKIDRNLF
jgi:hypothetical protein